MSTQRIKGQEVQVLLTRAGVLEDTLTDIQNFNVELEMEIISRGYLGRKSNDKDDIFNGVKGDMELHTHSQAWLFLIQAIIDRQKRVDPTLVVNVSAVLQYPNGDTPSVIFPDCKFGALPINISSRNEYVKKKIVFESDDLLIQAS